jgi:hypothetical protein
VPDAVSFSVARGPASLTANWSAPLNNGSLITGYNLFLDGVSQGTASASTFSFGFSNLVTCNYPSGNCSRTYTITIRAVNSSPVDIGFGPGVGSSSTGPGAQRPLVSYLSDNIGARDVAGNLRGTALFAASGCRSCHGATGFPRFDAAFETAYCDAAFGTLGATCTSVGTLSSRQFIYLCPENAGACNNVTTMGVYFSPGSTQDTVLQAWVNDGSQR